MGPSRLQLTKPVIAAVEGYAVAGGIELALWCDLRVAATSATFGVFCRRFGVPLIDGGTVRLPRLIGESRAMDLILTGRAVGAAEALELGLANRVVEDGQALAAALALARQIAAFPQQCLRNDRAERAPPARPAAARGAGAGVRARARDARFRRGRRRGATLRRRRRQARPFRPRLSRVGTCPETASFRGRRAHNQVMTIDGDAAYQVLLARDARFDGKLFVGVTSTGIYCRPICRVRTPARRNCRFFDSPAQAEAEAFRPCLKCRPEIAPGPGLPWTVMDASRTLAVQAAASLDASAASGETPSVAELAAHLGVSDRHLRRIFFAEHGVTPLQYLQTRRLLLAKQLLTDTKMPISQVALTSGFKSLRRFNAAFAGGYRMNPTRLRRTAKADGPAAAEAPPASDEAPITVTLGYRPPHDAAVAARLPRATGDPRHRGRRRPLDPPDAACRRDRGACVRERRLAGGALPARGVARQAFVRARRSARRAAP